MNQQSSDRISNYDDGQARSISNAGIEHLLIEASHILNSDLELQQLLKNVLKILTDYLNAEASAIYLTSYASGGPELFTFTVDGKVINRPHPPTEGIGVAARVIETKSPLMINDFNSEEALKCCVDEKLGLSSRNLVATPIFYKDQLLGVIEVANKKDKTDFSETDLTIMKALSEQIGLAISNAELIQSLRKKNIEIQSLYEVGKLLSGKLELEELLQIIIEQVFNLVKARLATIYLVDPKDGSIREVISMGVPPEYESKLTMKIGEGITGWVAKTGQAAVINNVAENRHYVPLLPETKSEIAVPLLSRGKVIGVFNVESDQLNAYSRDDLELLQTFASQAAISIERDLLYRQSLEQKAFRDELDIARRIQQTFLPKSGPRLLDYDIAGVNIPSEAVGGDYYDFIDIVENQCGIAIADVSGKGMGAALIMATYRASLKAEIRNNFAIRTILAKVNSLLYESINRENYVTAVYGVLDIRNHIFTYSNAGHPPPLLFKANGEVQELTCGGYAVGMFSDSTYEEASIYMGRDDIMLMYTDGVTEARDERGEEFGTNRLRELVLQSRNLSAKEILDKIVDSVNKFRDSSLEADDLTMILIKSIK
ncbi:MAG: SpoIIE family protein phosphatase [candidate division Zixibacteria bacterium]|nr:SpoIIE family protein phosphatase [candidate division Zixibacteria bacterium]